MSDCCAVGRARASEDQRASRSGERQGIGLGRAGKAPPVQGGAGAGRWLRTPLVEIHLTRAGFLMPFRCAL